MYERPPTTTTNTVKLSAYVDPQGRTFGKTDGTFRYWPDSMTTRVRWARVDPISDDVAIVPTHGAAPTLRDAVIAAHRTNAQHVEIVACG
jgi:hypothetical protein